MQTHVRSILDDRSRPRMLVVGDLMLDRYVWGEVKRISPEAPIPVLRIEREEDRPGGAASVASNLARLGCEVEIVGVVGEDEDGRRLRQLLEERGVGEKGVHSTARPTILKSRHLSRGQQVLRVDREQPGALSPTEATGLVRSVQSCLEGVSALVLSDYGKGVLSDEVLRPLLDHARTAGVPVIVDPKRPDFAAYRGATLITPNRGEAATASGISIDSIEAAERAARQLLLAHDLGAVALTLDRDGIVLAERDRDPVHLPTHPREVLDVTGAGDMVASIFAMGLAGGHDLPATAALANIAGGLVVSRVGVVSISRVELRAAVSHEAGQHLRKLIEPAEEFAAIRAACRERGQRVATVAVAGDTLAVEDLDRLRMAREVTQVVVALAPEASDSLVRHLAALEDVDYVLRGGTLEQLRQLADAEAKLA